MANRVKSGAQPKKKQAPRIVEVIATPNIRPQYDEYKIEFPEILDSVTLFNTYKRKIPPRQLPKNMKDHVLQGVLAGIRECHLAPDVLLLYTHKDDVVDMLYICRHDDLYGKRARQLSAQIKALR